MCRYSLCTQSVNPLVLAAVLPYLGHLAHLNVEGTNFDDFGLEQLGSWVQGGRLFKYFGDCLNIFTCVDSFLPLQVC